jgi:hypothetical protein
MNKKALWLLAAALPVALIAQTTPPADTLNNTTTSDSATMSNDIATNTTEPTANTTATDQPATSTKPKKNKKPMDATE